MSRSASSKPSPQRERPWIMRTYAGHSTAAKSNELYRTNLQKGQTGLSVAFDLPTQTGYDPDHLLARGEVGKVGVGDAQLVDVDRLAGAEIDGAGHAARDLADVCPGDAALVVAADAL